MTRKRFEGTIQKTCPYCLETFEAENDRRRFCCYECGKKYSNRKRRPTREYTKTCPECEQVFTTKNSHRIYCCDKCYRTRNARTQRPNADKSRRKQVEKNRSPYRWVECKCPKCGGKHKVYEHWTGTGTLRKFCSDCNTKLFVNRRDHDYTFSIY